MFFPVNLHNNTTLCLRCFSLKYQLTLWARFQVWEHRQPELLDSSLPQSRYWKHGKWVKKSQKTFFSDMKYILALVVKILQSKVRFGLAIVLTYRWTLIIDFKTCNILCFLNFLFFSWKDFKIKSISTWDY